MTMLLTQSLSLQLNNKNKDSTTIEPYSNVKLYFT